MTDDNLRGYVAPLGFEAELIEELGTRLKRRHGRLILAEAGAEPVWCHAIWEDPRTLAIRSISDATAQLRSMGALWALEPHEHHRRATLIAEGLPKLKDLKAEWMKPAPERKIGSWMLLAQDSMLASPRFSSPFPSGEVIFHEDKTAPSRAYLKLWELFTFHGVRPRAGERAIDLGACPGGWTWVLAHLGLHVRAVDRSAIDAGLMKHPNVEFQKGNVFTLKAQDVGDVDWMFSDVICYPEQLEKLIAHWMDSGRARNFVCTIKFQGKTDHAAVARLLDIPGTRAKHLRANKHEITWWLTR